MPGTLSVRLNDSFKWERLVFSTWNFRTSSIQGSTWAALIRTIRAVPFVSESNPALQPELYGCLLNRFVCMFCILSVVSLSLSPYCLRAQICNADVVYSLFVKRAPEKGMDNQPQAKLGLYTPLSAIKLKTGGQTSDLLGNVHEINPLIFWKFAFWVRVMWQNWMGFFF